MDLGLTGTVAVVMAASRGLGRATAELLAQEGCDLAIASRRQDAIDAVADSIRQATGRTVLARTVDLSKAESISGFKAEVEAAFGRVDILVNNGGGPPPGTFPTCSMTAISRPPPSSCC